MEKIIYCLLVYALLLAINLVESHIPTSSKIGDTGLATCTTDEECILHNQCDEVNKITKTRFLSIEDRKYLRTRLCRYINRGYHFCCKRKIEKKLVLPEVPVCGLVFSDRVSVALKLEILSHFDLFLIIFRYILILRILTSINIHGQQ